MIHEKVPFGLKGLAAVILLLIFLGDETKLISNAFAPRFNRPYSFLRKYDKSWIETRKLQKSVPSISTSALLSSLIIPSSARSPNDKNNNDAKKNKNRRDENEGNENKLQINIEKSPESSFWYTVVSSAKEEVLPHAPYLDSDGPLPSNAYQILSAKSDDALRYNKKSTCLMTVSVGLDIPNYSNINTYLSEKPVDSDSIIDGMHHLIDSGFTSFQFDNNSGPTMQTWGESEIYGKLKRMTPPSVLDSCHLSTRVNVPKSMRMEEMQKNSRVGYGYGRGEIVRRAISNSLLRMETDCLDSVQVVCESFAIQQYILYSAFLQFL